MGCHAGVKKYGPRTFHPQDCVFETIKTGARPLKTGLVYPECSPLKCDPVTGVYEPVTDPADECAGWMICGEDLTDHPGDECSVGILLQGCVNLSCVIWPASFDAAAIELWRRKKNCCITLESTYCGMPRCASDETKEKSTSKAELVSAKAEAATDKAKSKKKAA